MLTTSNISDIAEKVQAEERLSFDDGVRLFEQASLLELGLLADSVNRRLHQGRVFYNVNRHINPTNVCAKSCKFCAFSRKPGEEGAYEYSIEQVVEKAATVVEQGATEVHMVGGLHPRWRFQHYLDMLGALKASFPDLHIKAFTAVEIDWLAAKARLSVADTLAALREAGLGSMPGGGAEIFHPDVRLKICDTKTDANRWIDIHRTAHGIGLHSNATMLYGHIEQYQHRVDHMLRLRELQDETNGFNVFIPLAFQPHDNDMGIDRYTPGVEDLKTIAVARLFLDNFKHIKAYWIMLGQDVAQLALNFGANDLDGTVTEEKISRMAGGRAGMAMDKGAIGAVIQKARRIPVERDTLYHPLHEAGALPPKNPGVDLLLYKREKGEALSTPEAVSLAENADLLSLAACAKSLASVSQGHSGLAVAMRPVAVTNLSAETVVQHVERQMQPGLNVTRSSLPIDLSSLAADASIGVSQVADIVRFIRERYPSLTIVLQGFKGVLALAHVSDIPVERAIRDLSTAGVDIVESSLNETESDLTISEILSLHETCHEFDINTIAKVELSAPYSGPDRPFWEPYISKVEKFTSLNRKTAGVRGLLVVGDKDSFLTPSEYMRAVAIARIVADGVDHILAPFQNLPTIKQRPEASIGTKSDAALKLAPLVFEFGASDLSAIVDETERSRVLMDEMNLSGVDIELRDAIFRRANLT